MSDHSLAMVVMAKVPAAGRVKTRLSPMLSPTAAAAVQGVFLRHVVRRLNHLAAGALVVCYDPPDARAAMVDALTGAGEAILLAQSPGDLGQRLAAAAREMALIHSRVLFLGVDSPDVPDAFLVRAMSLTGEAAVSLGPTADGGYWFLGLQRGVDANRLLEGIDWSSGREAEQTQARAIEMRHALAIGDAWEDVDRPADLSRLMRRLAHSADSTDRRLLADLRPIVDAAGLD